MGEALQMTEQEGREAVVKEALTWEGTPFHDCGMVKGAGVDCLRFLYAPYRAVGLIEEIEIPEYSAQWFLNRKEERLIQAILSAGAKEIELPPQPADIVVVKFGRVFAHSAIVIDWPKIITANPHAKKVMVNDATIYHVFARREKKYFSYWAK